MACLLVVCAGFRWLFVGFVDGCGLMGFVEGWFGLILDFVGL